MPGIPCVTAPCWTETPGMGDFPGVQPIPSPSDLPTDWGRPANWTNTTDAQNTGDVSSNTFMPNIGLPTPADFAKIALPSATPTAPAKTKDDPCAGVGGKNPTANVTTTFRCFFTDPLGYFKAILFKDTGTVQQQQQQQQRSSFWGDVAKGTLIFFGLIILMFVLVIISLAENVAFRVNVTAPGGKR